MVDGPCARQQRKAAIILAVVDIYILDFVINIGMSWDWINQHWRARS
jgi:hypothetical protein